MSGPSSSPPAAAAFFDLDKTIIAGSSALAFSRPFRRQGLITRRAALRSGYAQLLIMLSGADAATVEALRRRITALCTGWEVAQIRAIVAETLHEIVEPLVYAEATELIAEHRANGDEVVVLSASGLEVVEPIAALVGADRCQATRMAIRNGRYTGEIELYLLRRAEGARPPATSPPRAGTGWRTAARTPTRSPTCRCSRRSGTRPPSTRTGRCAGWPRSAAGRSSPSPSRSPCAPRIRPATAAAVAGAGLGAAALVGAGWYGLRRAHR